MLPNDLTTPEGAAGLAALLGSTIVKTTIVLMLGTLCALAARTASSATRHMIWTLTLGGALVVPVAAAFVPKWHVPVARWAAPSWQPSALTVVSPAIAGPSSNAVLAVAIPAAGVSADRVSSGPVRRAQRAVAGSPTSAAPAIPAVSAIAPRTAVAATAPAVATPTGVVSATATPLMAVADASGFWTGVVPWAIGLWALGAMLALMPTLVGLARLALLRRRARPMRGGRWALLVPSAMRELDVRRRVQFLELDGDVMPMTWGLLHPVVLLP